MSLKLNTHSRAALRALVDRVERRRDWQRLAAEFHVLGVRSLVELVDHIDREHGRGDDIHAAISRALGQPIDRVSAPPPPYDNGDLNFLRFIAARRQQQEQRLAALHNLGPAGVLIVLATLDGEAVAAAENFMRRNLALSPTAIAAAGADRLVPPPIRRVQ
jgi:hypothetical protein